MTSPIVRTAFRAEIAAAFPAVPYVDTIAKNVETQELPPLWHSLEFAPQDEVRASIGTPCYWRERGVVFVSVVGVTGAGDAVVTTQAAAVLSHFRNWQKPSDGIIVTGVEVQVPAQESDGRWFFCAVAINYERGFFA
jgi:hypothetical protein